MENKSLAAALVKAQSEMKGAVKDTVNPFFKSKYADLGSVWEACHKALTDNGFSIVQAGAFHDGHFFLKTTLLHTSGESLSGEYLIKPTKEDPQAYGSAWTYARRYSLASMVGVISEDDDGAAASEPAPARQSAPAERTTGQAAAQGGSVISEPQGKRLFAMAMSAGKTKEELAGYLKNTYGISSTRELQRKDYEAACAWAEEKDETSVPF